MILSTLVALAAALLASPVEGAARAPDVAPFVSVDAKVVALAHVRVIDGTGKAPLEDQTVVIEGEKLLSIAPASAAKIPEGALVLDKTGYSVIPGLVGMHDHLFYVASAAMQRVPGAATAEPGIVGNEVPYSGPRLSLAAGVTTMRTTGSVGGYTDLKTKSRIDAGLMPGPHLDVTAPYLEGKVTKFAQLNELRDAADARRLVEYWAGEGATSFKGYMNLTRDELRAAIAEAHQRKLKVTAHLCSVTWKEAIEMGIDDLEHGPVFTDSGLVADKKPDVCPPTLGPSWANVDMSGPQVTALIQLLLDHGVAVTSTLPVFEALLPGRPKIDPRVLAAMSPGARESYLIMRASISESPMVELFKKEQQFELAFFRAGGLLLAGPDPTGNGGVLPGLGDQRALELLVEEGLTPLQAIQVGTANGARYLGQLDRIGTLAAGKRADLVLIKGDPSRNIADIENVETVFKDGIGFDSKKLLESVRGQVGIR